MNLGLLSRRRAMAMLAALAAVPAALFGPRVRAAADDAALDALLDRLLPGHGADPGARRLGLVPVILSDLRDGPHARAYRQAFAALTRRLDEDRFLDRDDAGRDDYVEQLLHQGGRDSDTARRLLSRAARRYYTHPGAWPSIGHTKPQPHGYPDFAACPKPDEPA